MKLSFSAVLLVCATASAYPLRDLDTTAPDLSTGNGTPQAQSSSHLSESVHNYLTRLRRGASALFAEDSLDTKPTPSESASTPEPTHDDVHHEALMASFGPLDQRFKELADKAHPNKRRVASTSDSEAERKSSSRRKAYHKILMESFSKLDLRYKELADKANSNKRAIPISDPEIEPKSSLRDVIARHGPECVALVIFILAPISFLFFYVLGLLFTRLTQERSPHRGRGPVRLDGPERDARALSNQTREASASEKSWWQAREQC